MIDPASIEVVRMSNKNPLMWSLMPQLLDRALQFGIDNGHQDTEQVASGLKAAFVQDGNETFAAWVVVERVTWRVVAHLIATEMSWCGRPAVFVMQLVIDPKTVPLETVRMVKSELRAWARSRSAGEILAFTKKPKMRAWWRIFRFKAYRVLMRDDMTDLADAD